MAMAVPSISLLMKGVVILNMRSPERPWTCGRGRLRAHRALPVCEARPGSCAYATEGNAPVVGRRGVDMGVHLDRRPHPALHPTRVRHRDHTCA